MTQTTEPERVTITTPAEREIRLERIFNAPRERVWRAYTEPDLVAQWWGRGNKLVVERLELERGGHWRFVVHKPDGTVSGFEGRFREVAPPERFVKTLEWDGLPGHVCVWTAELRDLGDARTKLIVTDIFHTTEERDGVLKSGVPEGLDETYAALDRLLATLE